jgi:hypothetical protein
MAVPNVKVLNNLLVNQEKITKIEQLEVFVTFSGYLFPKNKPIRTPTKSGAKKIRPTSHLFHWLRKLRFKSNFYNYIW